MLLKGKVAIITGASSGVGYAAAVAFAARGAKVVAAARREDRLKNLCDTISKSGGEAAYFKADITQEDEVKRLFDFTAVKYGTPDILVNNAGRGLKSKICDTSIEEWDSVLSTNLTAVFLCTREAARRMIDNNVKGHIITVSSIAGLYGTPNYGAYCASKHGVTGFKRSAKWELMKHGIKVTTIHPGRIDTEFFDVYPQRPAKNQMLSAADFAEYITAVAERRFFKALQVKFLNLGKRIYYFLKH